MLWLEKHKISYRFLFMREEGDLREDYVVKEAMLESLAKLGYWPLLVVEDRQQCVDMWRSHGICTLQPMEDDFYVGVVGT